MSANTTSLSQVDITENTTLSANKVKNEGIESYSFFVFKNQDVRLADGITLTLKDLPFDGDTGGESGLIVNSTITGKNANLLINISEARDAHSAFGHIGSTTIDVNKLVIDSAYSAIQMQGRESGASTVTAKTIDINTAYHSIFVATDTATLQGFESASVTSTDGSAVKANGGTVKIISDVANSTATLHSVESAIEAIGSGAVTVKADNVNISSEITDDGLSNYKRHAVYVAGTTDLTARKNLQISTTGSAALDAINVVSGGILNVKAGSATVDGTVSNAGTMNLTGNSTFNDKVTNTGVISIDKGVSFFKGGLISTTSRSAFSMRVAGPTVNVGSTGTLSLGEGSRVDNVNVENGATLGLESTDVQVNSVNGGTFNATVSGDINDQSDDVTDVVSNSIGNGGNATLQRIHAYAGTVADEVTLTSDGQGGYTVTSRTTNTALSDSAELNYAAGVAATQALTNDIRKRLGDLRYADAQNGAWVRYDGGRMSGTGVDTKFNSLQMGYDTVAFRDDVRLGASLSYTRGDTDIRRGTSDMDAYSLALYGAWTGDNGMFADVVARVATIKNDMTIVSSGVANTGKLDNVAYAISGEFGQRFDVAKNFFLEPQVEVSYTYIESDSAKIGDSAKYDFDSIESLRGRAGVVAGWTCPNQKGHVYARASVVREFMGDSTVTGRTAALSNKVEVDGQDTWAEIGLGAQYNINKNAYVWADVERTQGANINEDFRGTVGVRFNF